MYFEKRGKQNTQEVVELVIKTAREKNISTVVVASCTGATARLLMGKGLNIVCVTHQVGYAKAGEDEMPQEARDFFISKGIKVLTATHLFAGVDRALRLKFQGVYPGEIIASALRMFGQGVKVCVEIAVMALDAGVIPYQEDIIAVAGTATGADAAVILQPAHSQNFFDTSIKEIICMPRGK